MSDSPYDVSKGRPTARSAPTGVDFVVDVKSATVNSCENDIKFVKIAFKVLFLLLR